MSSAAEPLCGITVRADRIVGAEGESAELVLRRTEVVALRIGSAAHTELPWLEGPVGAALALLTAFLLAVRLAGGARTYGAPAGAHVLIGSAASVLLTRTFHRRPALVADLRSGDRRRIWAPGSDADRERLRGALRTHRWPLVS